MFYRVYECFVDSDNDKVGAGSERAASHAAETRRQHRAYGADAGEQKHRRNRALDEWATLVMPGAADVMRLFRCRAALAQSTASKPSNCGGPR